MIGFSSCHVRNNGSICLSCCGVGMVGGGGVGGSWSVVENCRFVVVAVELLGKAKRDVVNGFPNSCCGLCWLGWLILYWLVDLVTPWCRGVVIP